MEVEMGHTMTQGDSSISPSSSPPNSLSSSASTSVMYLGLENLSIRDPEPVDDTASLSGDFSRELGGSEDEKRSTQAGILPVEILSLIFEALLDTLPRYRAYTLLSCARTCRVLYMFPSLPRRGHPANLKDHMG